MIPNNYTKKGPGRKHKQGNGALRINRNGTVMNRKWCKGRP